MLQSGRAIRQRQCGHYGPMQWDSGSAEQRNLYPSESLNMSMGSDSDLAIRIVSHGRFRTATHHGFKTHHYAIFSQSTPTAIMARREAICTRAGEFIF